MTTRHVADITDPVTGETTTLTAATEGELDQLVDEHLEQHYPPSRARTPSQPAWGDEGVTSVRRNRGRVSVVGGSVEDTNHPGRADHLAP